MKLSDLPTHDDIVAADLEDPAYRAEWERTRFAHEVAKRVIQYRIDHSLTQAELARQLGMRQPHVARLEAGEHEPSLTTLRRLAQRLGVSFHIEITPTSEAELTA
ncbi:MAG TPA: helix-turn-helix transcriptional regulator [Chloroflexota bacterium]|nr:helix-turn-helix transcriptional regulator [Chloroflexota bacterium]